MQSKGAEQPPAIFYILFTSIMMIFAIVVLVNLASNMNVDAKYSTFNLRFNSIAARLLYSPSCLATELPYTGELGVKNQVLPLVIDMQKVKDRTYRDCIDLETKKQYDFSIAKIGKISGERYETTYYDFGEDTFTKTKDTYCDGNWERISSFFVVINEAGTHSKGVLTFCMSEEADE